LKKGFSLPLWVAGAARSALKNLLGSSFQNYELIKIPNEKRLIKIEVHSAALIQGNSHAMGITYAKSDLALDLTQNLEIWTIASLEKTLIKNVTQENQINIIAGQGVGIDQNTSKICISLFAKEVLYENLLKMNHREITKKYSELLNKAEFATGRKEVVGLLKKAAKLKSQIEINY